MIYVCLCLWASVIYKAENNLKSINGELKYFWSSHTLEHLATTSNDNTNLYLLIQNNNYNILMNEKRLHILFDLISVNMLVFVTV